LREPLGDFLEEAKYVVDASRDNGTPLRVLGATAVRIHSPDSIALHKAMGRELSDIDFMAYQKHEGKVIDLMRELGYAFDDRAQYLMTVSQRYIFRDRTNDRNADIFFDKLDFCHTVDFRKRLEIDYPTVSLADLILEKLQIVRIETKDLKDAIVLLREHNVGSGSNETIDAEYVAKLLANDWGFWYTVTSNMAKMQDFLQTLTMMPQDDRDKTSAKIMQLQDRIEKGPKSVGWKMRAKIGTKKQWYKTVDESPDMD
jgi:hypothetical protein